MIMLRIGAVLVAATLIWAVLSAGMPQINLGAEVRAHAVVHTGTAQPVTAVLLGFRAYDTLLEVAVLLLAALGAGAPRRSVSAQPVDPVLGALVKNIVPLMALVAGYLLWAGTKQPGGAFQAAAVLAGAGVLILLAGEKAADPHTGGYRIALAAGLAVFLVLFLSGSLAPMLLFLEAVLTISIAAALLSLFASGRP